MRKNFYKVVLPGYEPEPKILHSILCEVEYEDGRLSVVGVVGPKSNGNAWGGCGQIYGSYLENPDSFVPAEGWTHESSIKFFQMWDRWHLNDMNAYCEHQRELGWPELAKKEVFFYHWTLTRTSLELQDDLKNFVMDELKAGRSVTPTADDVAWLARPYEVITSEPIISAELATYYGPRPERTERKTLGWTRPKEHPEGLLTKECPVCGYKAGTTWLHEELPDDVYEYFFNLPDSPVALPGSWGRRGK